MSIVINVTKVSTDRYKFVKAKMCIRDRVKAFIQEHRNDSDRISFHMGPHANYTCPSPTLKEIIDVAKELNLPIHLHVSEEDVQVLSLIHI